LEVFRSSDPGLPEGVMLRFAHNARYLVSLLLMNLGAPESIAEDVPQSLVRVGLPQTTYQLLLVTATGWETPQGTLRFYTRRRKSWEPDGPPIQVTLGRNGMAWGRGRFSLLRPMGAEKVEGDAKSPAGIFELGEAFGYGEKPPPGCRLPYRVAGNRDYFVDDPQSEDYNSWVRLAPNDNFPEKRWKSFERMKLESDVYELGIVVKHNTDPAVPAKGSAIFLHLWSGPDKPTVGCTAMSRELFLKLLQWLDPSKKPLLIQLPETELRETRIRFLP
jgi:L,D-peptidoglycan transpeptidase YkuD (ErfK/YbiS/YcfS/YnhG family)